MDFTAINAGITREETKIVSQQDTAAAYGSGLLEVFATPAMIALMEHTCMQLVEELLPNTHGTVGTSVEVKHMKATAVNDTVICKAILAEANGSKLTFEVEAHDSTGMIGKGIHKRYIIDNEAFMASIK